MYQDKENLKPTIRKLDKEKYVVCSTGEVKEFSHSTSRKDNLKEVRRSLARLRNYINTNVIDTTKCKWLTVTYVDNMTDTDRLQKDLRRFIRRCRSVYGHFEYITACEPQGRGAWHAHAIFIFDGRAPFMPSDDVSTYWGNGFVKVDKLKDCDNVGAYLTAYLGDMEMNLSNEHVINQIDVSDLQVKTVKNKRFIKGARLLLYPPGFNLYRISRGIKSPTITKMSYKQALKKVNAGTKTFSKNIKLHDKEFEKLIRYEYYNAKRTESKSNE